MSHLVYLCFLASKRKKQNRRKEKIEKNIVHLHSISKLKRIIIICKGGQSGPGNDFPWDLIFLFHFRFLFVASPLSLYSWGGASIKTGRRRLPTLHLLPLLPLVPDGPYQDQFQGFYLIGISLRGS